MGVPLWTKVSDEVMMEMDMTGGLHRLVTICPSCCQKSRYQLCLQTSMELIIVIIIYYYSNARCRSHGRHGDRR